ncbi:MAG: hypothetical protein AB7N73_16195 [Gemmatimonadales bacterium]
MARIRTIKPDFFASETVAQVSIPAMVTFSGLWTYVDDDGRGRANARLIKGAIWPLRDEVTAAVVEEHLDELESVGLVRRYQVDGQGYLLVKGFTEHQRVNRKVDSKLPPPPGEPAVTTHGARSESSVSHGDPEEPESEESQAAPDVQGLSESAVSRHGGRTEGSPLEGNGKGRERKGKERSRAPDGATRESLTLEPPPDASSWPGRLAQEWTEHIGTVNPGRLGKALSPIVKRHGEELVRRAIRHFGREMLAEGRLRFASPEEFARTAAQWVDDAKPIREEGS